MVGTIFYRLSWRLGASTMTMTDPANGPLRLPRITVDGPPTDVQRGDELERRDTPPRPTATISPTRRFTGRGNGMQDVAAAAAAAALAPPLPPARVVLLGNPAVSTLRYIGRRLCHRDLSTRRVARTSRPRRLSATKVAIDQYFSKKTPACERGECGKR
ncbi:Uncharacterized protein DBV15_11070 [Temnothorax longispinosus]|uniref:Uncharacterized protein n=1 Tax=Temnothorax longispinosus TaxID=300112 RepID=A0A4V3SBP3_9HYME|nr:Uncharacterized protein DBV15_11070 [Temnothorax longispinosus]